MRVCLDFLPPAAAEAGWGCEPIRTEHFSSLKSSLRGNFSILSPPAHSAPHRLRFTNVWFCHHDFMQYFMTFLGSSKANLVWEKLDKNLGLADPSPSVGTKSQNFPKIWFEGFPYSWWFCRLGHHLCTLCANIISAHNWWKEASSWVQGKWSEWVDVSLQAMSNKQWHGSNVMQSSAITDTNAKYNDNQNTNTSTLIPEQICWRCIISFILVQDKYP